jgi:hypothetical protein
VPIRPENAARYPKDWKTAIVPAVRKRSKNRCECRGQCGINHGSEDRAGRCKAVNGGPHPITGSKVILTVAHKHGEPLESRNIAGMFHACQQCHNKYDAPHRRAGIKARARAGRAIADLFEGPK